MRLMIIGGNSRLGRAIARACPSATSVVRSDAKGEAVIVPDYHAVTASDMAGFDVVVNCSGLVKGREETLHQANVALPAQLFACAREAQAGHFIHVSSFAVHGRATLIDHATPIEPTGSYGRSKAEGERVLLEGPGADSLSIVRLPMLYGEGDSKLSRLIRTWVKIGGWPMPNGDVARAMMHYDLAAAVIVRLGAERPRGPVAAADSTPFSYALAQSAIRSTGRRAAVISLPRWGARAFRAIGGDSVRALFADSVLADSQNLAVSMALPSRLQSDIAAMVLR